jgi:transposase
MPIVGGIDIHREQLTFDYVDTGTGEVRTGQIRPADREHLRWWLGRHAAAGPEDMLAFEACTGWRYVAEEITRAGATALLAEPADTAAARGRKKRAKTDKADARLLRVLAERGQVPACWIPPGHVLEARALLETYHDLRAEHTAWVQRIHAVLFHQGAPAVHGFTGPGGRQQLERAAAAHLSPSGRRQVQAALQMIDGLDEQLDDLRHELRAAAKRLKGAVALQELWGVGPLTALALVCWLGGAGRFTSSRQAVRFTGLDITVYSTGGKRTRGHLSRQGPPVLRWLLYEAGKTHGRAGHGSDHGYYAQVKERSDGKRAALSEARKITRRACHVLASLGDDAFTLV